jgi:hypothetical protein
MERPKLIKNANTRPESKKSVMNGVIRSAYLTEFQRQAMTGIVKDAMPSKMGPALKMLEKVKPGKTHQDIGVVHYPGSKYGQSKRK